jgi:hypothetical protein
MGHVDLGALGQQHAAHMLRRSGACGAEGEGSRIAPSPGDELGEILRRHRAADGDSDRRVHAVGQGRQVLQRIESHVLSQVRADGDDGLRGQQDAITVRRGIRYIGRADAAAGTGTIFDDHGLAHAGGEPCLQRARPARRPRQADRA